LTQNCHPYIHEQGFVKREKWQHKNGLVATFTGIRITIKAEVITLGKETSFSSASTCNRIVAVIKKPLNSLNACLEWIKSSKPATKELEGSKIKYECNLSHPCGFGY